MLPDLLTGHEGPRLRSGWTGELILDGPQAVLVSNNPYGDRGHRRAGPAGAAGHRRARRGRGARVESAAQAAGLLRGAAGRPE